MNQSAGSLIRSASKTQLNQ